MPAPMKLADVEVYFDQKSGVLAELKDLLWEDGQKIRAVDGVSLEVNQNVVQGVIGESGCGKTTLLETMVGLEDPTGGEVYFRGNRVSGLTKPARREFYKEVQMIFQDPFNSLDPKYTISEMLGEQLDIHGLDDTEERKLEMLREVELSPAERYIDQYPEQLSGGEKQRASIARALIVDPDVILADEPVSMLDVSTQASILRLLSDIVEDGDIALTYISHDISTVSQICDQINVMYLGRVVEQGPTTEVLQDPKHPYTQSLIQAVPVPDPHRSRERVKLQGDIPDPLEIPEGCRFKNRCPEQMGVCDIQPFDHPIDENRNVACHLYYDHEEVTSQSDTVADVADHVD